MTGQNTLSPATNKPIAAAIKTKAIAAKILNAMMKPIITKMATRAVNAKIEAIGSKSYSASERCKSNH